MDQVSALEENLVKHTLIKDSTRNITGSFEQQVGLAGWTRLVQGPETAGEGQGQALNESI